MCKIADPICEIQQEPAETASCPSHHAYQSSKSCLSKVSYRSRHSDAAAEAAALKAKLKYLKACVSQTRNPENKILWRAKGVATTLDRYLCSKDNVDDDGYVGKTKLIVGKSFLNSKGKHLESIKYLERPIH